MEINKIYNEDNLVTMENHIDKNSIDVILTSPPYNTSRKQSKTNKSNNSRLKNLEIRYDVFNEDMSNDDYINWTVNIFEHFDKILKKDGCIVYNISYGSENKECTECMFRTVNDILVRTNFTVADCITWKKKSATPNNRSANKLTRITEFVFIFCRKDEFATFVTNKKVKTIMETGQKNYENIYNFIEAANNDGSNPLNKATYSTELCEKLLNIYARPNSVIYDPFMGTGTTAVAATKLGHSYIGSEISPKQTEYAKARLSKMEENEMIIGESFF